MDTNNNTLLLEVSHLRDSVLNNNILLNFILFKYISVEKRDDRATRRRDYSKSKNSLG